MPDIVPLSVITGFIAGVIVNLIADYLPARRHHTLARNNPFVSRDAIPSKPSLLLRGNDGRILPPYLWSGVIAAIMKKSHYRHQTRRIIIEVGLALVFGFIGWRFYSLRNLPFMLFYAATLALIVIIDVEHRWVFLEIIVPTAIIALVEATYWPRVWINDAIQGGIRGFGVMLGLYILGIGFAFLMRLITGRRVGRTVLGIGDVYIGTLGGLLIGSGALGFALLIMVLTGAIAAIIFIVNRWRKMGRYRKFGAIPYGPYIVIGIAAMLYIPQIINDIAKWIVWGG
jgi:prepilin signal peptidase PulO-like enzyme (type II secretory pathway)